MDIFSLQAGKYDPVRQRWSPILQQEEGKAVEVLKVATYNVWFDPHFAEVRYPAVLDILARTQAHLIALQEVTPNFLRILLQAAWVQERYYCSDIHGESVDPYGIVLLSRFPMDETHLVDLPSLMYRKFLFADLQINGSRMRVGTVHLESQPQYANWRVEQMREIFPCFEGLPQGLLMGDFNFHGDAQPESSCIPPDFLDLWPALYPKDPGFTEDTDVNLMRLKVKGKRKQVRFDRILLKSAQENWKPQRAGLLGTAPVAPDLPEVFPSDHSGLWASLTYVR